MLLTELAHSNGLQRSAILSYSRGSRRYEGAIRAALGRMVDRSIVATDDSCGRRRYKLNLSNLNALLLGEAMAPRAARSG